MNRFNYNMDNVNVLCRNEEELKKAIEIATLFGFFPSFYCDLEECIDTEISTFNAMKSSGKVALRLYVNKYDITETSLYCTPVSAIENFHSLRCFKWLEKLYEEYSE